MRLCGRPIRGSSLAIIALMTGMVMAPAGAAFASIPIALHEKKHDTKKQVEALEEQWRIAQLAGDVATMDKLLSDDYIGISMTGQVHTKAQQLDRARNRKFVLTRLDLNDMQVKLVGAIAVVTSRAEVEGANDGVPVKGTFRYTRVYQRSPAGVWKITSFESTRVPEPGVTLQSNHDRDVKALK